MAAMEDTVQALDYLISQFLSLDRSIWSSSDDANAFLQAVGELTATICSLDGNSVDHLLLDRSDDLLERCASRLGGEFQHLIEMAGLGSDGGDHVDKGCMDDDSCIVVAQPVRNLDVVIDTLPEGAILEANRIASRMAAAGFGDECAKDYAAARSCFIAESIRRLGFDVHLAEKSKQSSWEHLEPDIACWISAVRAVFHILIPNERLLCDRIFVGFPSYGNLAFATTCQPLLELLSFANDVASSSRSPDCLFRMLDMYNSVTGILQVLDHTFRSEVTAIRESLGSSIKSIFMVIENLIRRDPSDTAVPDGRVHPMTRYVMNYLVAACASRHTLEEVMLMDFGVAGSSPVDPDRPTSSFAIRIAWIVDVLRKNLESKSKVYGHVPLSCIFLINNGRYMIKKAHCSELKVLLGEDWTNEMSARVRHWALEYRRATWTKAVLILQKDGGFDSNVNMMREKLRHFNDFLEAICQVQSRWLLADRQVGGDLSSSVEGLVLPVYRDAVEKFRAIAAVGTEVYMRPEDVRSRIQQLFKAMAR